MHGCQHGEGGRTGRNRGVRRGRSAGLVDHHAPGGEEWLCGTCGDDVGPQPIGCDMCEQWVHATQMCSGLPLDLITAILKYEGAGIKFICMKCRVDQVTARGNSPSGRTDPQLAETVSQLYLQVKGMCSVIKDLTSQVKSLSSKSLQAHNHDAALGQTSAPPPPPPPPPPPQEEYRAVIREEVKEQKEREKRRNFLIVKGLPASSPTDFGPKFAQLTSDYAGTRVTPSEILAVPGHSNYFRVKIPDDNTRKLLLDKARELRGTEHQNVFVSRDLTYAQRTEMYRRRQARQAEGAAAGHRDRAASSGPAAGAAGARADNDDSLSRTSQAVPAPAAAPGAPEASGSGNGV